MADTEPKKLCAEFSAASRQAHDISNSILQARLVVLFTDRRLYGRALGCFLHVFRALEELLLKCKDHPDIKRCWEPLNGGLFRTKGFEEDLEFFLGPTWQQLVAPGQAVQRYVQHLQQLAGTNPSLLLAHSYTQHLALASGGQTIKRMARKQMGLPEDKGTAAFDFAKATPGTLKAAFISALNQLGDAMSPELKEEMISEHVHAFKFNNAIISEFRVGWWTFMRGLVLLLPPMSRLSLVLLGAVVVVTYYRGGAS